MENLIKIDRVYFLFKCLFYSLSLLIDKWFETVEKNTFYPRMVHCQI